MTDFPPYPSGLRLAGRRVLVVGGGHVAQRRVPQLIAVGADVHVVAPEVTMSIEGLVGSGEVTWHERAFADADVEGAWYVLALTDDKSVNDRISALCEDQRVFCVRSDDATLGTAWTPAVGRHDDLTIAVIGNRDPRRSAVVRDSIVECLEEGKLEAPHGREPHEVLAGTVTLVGGGPGHPDLITVAGRKALAAADVVVADRLAPRELLSDLPADVELIDVAKLPRGRYASQDYINKVIVERALAGHHVVRFKGGDNFVFGRGYEEIIACREAGVPVTVIPGLTSPVSVPAIAGIPVTHRGITHEFCIVSGHLPPEHPESLVNYAALAQMQGTIVLMMAVENAPAIAAALVKGGRPDATPVAVVCDGTMPTQRTVLATLGTLVDRLVAEQVKPPAIIVIGEVVRVAHPDAF